MCETQPVTDAARQSWWTSRGDGRGAVGGQIAVMPTAWLKHGHPVLPGCTQQTMPVPAPVHAARAETARWMGWAARSRTLVQPQRRHPTVSGRSRPRYAHCPAYDRRPSPIRVPALTHPPIQADGQAHCEGVAACGNAVVVDSAPSDRLIAEPTPASTACVATTGWLRLGWSSQREYVWPAIDVPNLARCSRHGLVGGAFSSRTTPPTHHTRQAQREHGVDDFA